MQTARNIFLLEDDDDIRNLVAFILEADGYAVKSFASVSQFRYGLQTEAPDLFLLDIMLPDGNGLDVCHCLKHHDDYQEIPVILMSAGQVTRDQANLANDFLRKPFDIDDLQRRVRNLS